MWQKTKNTLIYGFVRLLLFKVRFLPWGLALSLGGWLGAVFFRWVPKERERAVKHLSIGLPELSTEEKNRLARDVFMACGRNAMELAKMFSYPTVKILNLVSQLHGREHMEAALAQQHGVLCLAAHLGNWEILPIFTHHQGWQTAVVAQSLYDGRLDQLLNQFRQAHGITIIKRQQVTREIIRCLRNNMLLGILNDQDTRVDSRWADFFGRPAKTPVGIIRMARKYRTPIVPVFIARQPHGRNEMFIEPELPILYSDNEEADLLQGARLCNQAIEAFVRRFPDQWVWFHERWKSSPQEERGNHAATV